MSSFELKNVYCYCEICPSEGDYSGEISGIAVCKNESEFFNLRDVLKKLKYDVIKTNNLDSLSNAIIKPASLWIKLGDTITGFDENFDNIFNELFEVNK